MLSDETLQIMSKFWKPIVGVGAAFVALLYAFFKGRQTAKNEQAARDVKILQEIINRKAEDAERKRQRDLVYQRADDHIGDHWTH